MKSYKNKKNRKEEKFIVRSQEQSYNEGYFDAENGCLDGHRMEDDDDYYLGAKAFSEASQDEDFGRITQP